MFQAIVAMVGANDRRHQLIAVGEKAERDRDNGGDDQVRERPRKSHERLTASAVAQVVRVDRRRLGPADAKAQDRLMMSIAPPTGSKWPRGSSVSRPCQRAVESPSRYAASAWLNSWTGNAIRMISRRDSAMESSGSRPSAAGRAAPASWPRIPPA